MVKEKFQVLLIAPPLEKMGGVADFCRMLRSHLNPDFNVSLLTVGSLNEREALPKRCVNFIRSAARLIRSLEKKKFDVIQINPSFKPYSLIRDSFYLLLINLFFRGERTIVFFHGWDQNLAEKVKKNAILRGILRQIYKRIGLIIVLFSHSRQQLIDMGLSARRIITMTTMYEGHNSDSHRGVQEERIDRSRDGQIKIIFMSRLLKEKGVFIAAETARALVKNRRQDFRMTFAGDGPEYQNLKKFISENGLERYMDAAGYVLGRKKEILLKQGDIFFFPTYYGEGCPVVILEAMGAGLAIVSTPVGAIPEIIKHKENGLIIESRDPNDFAGAITQLMEDPNLLRSIQEANRKKAMENYEATVVSRKIEGLYRSLANG